MSTTGLIVGRFYPFHKGHRFLVQTALDNADRVFLVVTGRYGQTIDYEQRADWIRTSFAREVAEGRLVVKTFHQDAAGIPDRSTSAWSEAARKTIGFSPDILFTSEPYQNGLADALGADFFVVDSNRKSVPISATRIRENPEAWKHMLEPHVYRDIQNKILADDGAARFVPA